MDRRKFLAAASGALTLSGFGLFPPSAAAAATRNTYVNKIVNFDANHGTDIFLDAGDMPLLKQVVRRLKRVQSTVGYGNFHSLGFDGMLKIGRQYASVQAFTGAEIEFLERLFHEDASHYGFYGKKVLTRLTDEIRRKRTVKIRGYGQRVFKGPPYEKYLRMRRAVGEDLVLTSGVRGIVKQAYLFLNKAVRAEGNLSRASRQLAPPGYSYHAVGDFDIGKHGLGRLNFTNKFAETDVYQQLTVLGFFEERYPALNELGVRYEPWHVKVVR